MKEMIIALEMILEEYSFVLKTFYWICSFIFGFLINYIIRAYRRRKLKRVIGLNLDKKNVDLYVPVREKAVYKINGKEEHFEDVVIYDEMQAAVEIRKCIADISPKLCVSTHKGTEQINHMNNSLNP